MPTFRPDPWQSDADSAAIAEAKRVLRRAVLTRRRVRPESQRGRDDADRFEQFRSFVGDSRPDVVACYLSAPPEPGTLQLIAWLAARRIRVLLPVITAPTDHDHVVGAPDWAPYAGPDRLRQGPLSIIEPTTDPLGAAALAEATLIIVPGLAGTLEGNRLGRGGGWYDRALEQAGRQSVSTMLLNDDEVVDVVPTHPWDRRVDIIITPTRTLDCTRH